MRLASILCAILVLAGGTHAKDRWDKVIAPGVTYRMETRNGTLTVHAVRITPSANVHLAPALAGRTVFEPGTLGGRKTVSNIALETGALVAVNADFFPFGKTPNGDPLGLMVEGRELLSTPFGARCVFAWGAGYGEFGATKFEARLDSDGIEALKIDGVNGQCGTNEIQLYTPRAGQTAPRSPNLTVELVPDSINLGPRGTVNATVAAVSRDGGAKSIAADRWVLVAHGDEQAALANLAVGSQVTITTRTTGLDWSRAENAIGGGPRLLTRGNVTIDGLSEKFPTSFIDVRHPRTAIGRTPEGDIWLVVVDGRSESSSGCTLPELARLMRDFGCDEAMNLDGGGSTTMTIQGLTVNHPSDGRERAVANGLVVLAGRAEPSRGPLRVKIRRRDAKASIGKREIDNANVVWSASGPVNIDQGGRLSRIGPGVGSVYARSLGLLGSAPVPKPLSELPPAARPRLRRRSSRPEAATESTLTPPRRRSPEQKLAHPRRGFRAQTEAESGSGPKSSPTTSVRRTRPRE